MKLIIDHLMNLKINSPEIKEIPRINELNEYIAKYLDDMQEKAATLWENIQLG